MVAGLRCTHTIWRSLRKLPFPNPGRGFNPVLGLPKVRWDRGFLSQAPLRVKTPENLEVGDVTENQRHHGLNEEGLQLEELLGLSEEVTPHNFKIVVIQPVHRGPASAPTSRFEFEEAQGLAQALEHWEVAHAKIVQCRDISPSLFLGKGKVELLKTSIADLVEATAAKQMEAAGATARKHPRARCTANSTHSVHIAVFVNATLAPTQQRNLQAALKYDRHGLPRGAGIVKVTVWDRFAIILEVFAERAHSKEAQLQVDLARIGYMRSRLVRHGGKFGLADDGGGLKEVVSARQRGGAGYIFGAGETQLEVEHRLLDHRETFIRRELEGVRKTRAVQRQGRRVPVCAVIGYTNAGKSAVVRALSRDSEILVRDQLFASLQPTMRGITIPSGRRAMLSDTVGFISALPHQLVAAFSATLEEVLEAHVLLHVRDLSHPLWNEHKQTVLEVLLEVGVPEEVLAKRTIEVWNKVDLLEDDSIITARRRELGPDVKVVPLSALHGTGCDMLLNMLDWTIDWAHFPRAHTSAPRSNPDQ